MLFDKKIRSYMGFKSYSESEFHYLNRSARKHCEIIRRLLENWLEQYPPDKKRDLVTRFRSSDNLEYKSAFFELYLHELFLKMSLEIEIHPGIEEKSTHPEFLVTSNKKQIFYLEGTVTAGSKEEVAAEKRENTVYDTLDRMDSPNFFIGVKVSGAPNTPPPGAKWRKFLEKKLSKLDPYDIIHIYKTGGLRALPSWKKEHDGWNVTFRAIPKSPKARGKQGVRPVGFRMTGFWLCKDHENIRNAIKDKATKYGELKLPYIIAINVLSGLLDDISGADALFGQEGFAIINKGEGVFGEQPARKPNGAWWGPQGWQNTRVSATLIFKNLLPRSIAKITPVLWHHPMAKYPIDPKIWLLPQEIVNKQSGHIERIKGKNTQEIFDLPENWPIVDNAD